MQHFFSDGFDEGQKRFLDHPLIEKLPRKKVGVQHGKRKEVDS